MPEVSKSFVFSTRSKTLYRYKRTQFPSVDPDEHMKLARWCLTSPAEGRGEGRATGRPAAQPRALRAGPCHAPVDRERGGHSPACRPATPRRSQTSAEVAEGPSHRPDEVQPGRPPAACGGGDEPPRHAPDLRPAPGPRRQAGQRVRSARPPGAPGLYCAKCHDEQYPGPLPAHPDEEPGARTMDAPMFSGPTSTPRSHLIDPRNPAHRARSSPARWCRTARARTHRPIFRRRTTRPTRSSRPGSTACAARGLATA